MFIIQDWAGNLIGSPAGVPYSFDTFDDAWSWIWEIYPEDMYDDLFVIEVR